MEEIGESITLDPRPGYVLKTRVVELGTIPPGSKVFINICQDSQVPKPAQDFDPIVVFPLIVDNKWEIPIIVSQEKKVKDKLGNDSYCYDCCINEACFRWCSINSDLRSILNEWSIEAVELLHTVVLDRQYTTPKMLNKGPLSQTVIRKDELTEDGLLAKLKKLKENESLGILEELRGEEDRMEGIEDTVNIFGARAPTKRVLIEEIDSPNPPNKITPKIEDSTRQIDYTVNFKKITGSRDYTIVVTFESNVPYENVLLNFKNDNLEITSKKPYFFNTTSQKSILNVPLAHSPKKFKSFSIKDKILVFC